MNMLSLFPIDKEKFVYKATMLALGSILRPTNCFMDNLSTEL